MHESGDYTEYATDRTDTHKIIVGDLDVFEFELSSKWRIKKVMIPAVRSGEDIDEMQVTLERIEE